MIHTTGRVETLPVYPHHYGITLLSILRKEETCLFRIWLRP